jgi:DNA replication protein DnaC
LAVTLAIVACQRGFSIYFTTLDDLVQQLKTYLKPALLVVDEVGISSSTAWRPITSSN